MAKKETAATVETAAASGDAKAERKFSLDVLQTHCRELFGVSTPAFVGATSNLDATAKYSVAEIDSTIKRWCRTEVK